MEKLSETKKRGSSTDENDDKPKHQRRSGGDAIEYLAERAKVSDQLKEEDLKMKKDQQTLSREKMEVLSKHQIQTQQQQADMLMQTYAAATATKPTALTQLSNDDDAAATATVKGFDGVIEKDNK